MFPKLKVLIIDDEETMRELTSFMTLALQMKPTTASSARQGLCYLQKVGGFDLILSDFDMPEMNGLDFLQAIKADPALRNIPVIIVTAESSQERFNLCHDAGASGYLVKDSNYSKEPLQKEIERVLRSQSD